MAGFMNRAREAWNVLRDKGDREGVPSGSVVTAYHGAASHNSYTYSTSAQVLAPLVTRLSIDVAQLNMKHCIVDVHGGLIAYKQSELQDRLAMRANVDQSGRAFIQDAVMTLLHDGAAALCPIDTTNNMFNTNYEILSARVGSITQWFTESVMVSLYNQKSGQRAEVELSKDYVGIAYNPLYAVMNQKNSTLQRLIDRLAILDVSDGKINSPQLDLLIQLPYALKGERKQAEAERRIQQVQKQLEESLYGIGYVDSTEKVIQLNRPVVNNLAQTVVDLTESLHSQLGMSPGIFVGNAPAEEIVTYHNRTILPIATALTDAMNFAFFTKTALSQGNRIIAMPDLFKMESLSTIADAADKFTRNEILTTNEVRARVGLLPSSAPDADSLRNKNLNKAVAPEQEQAPPEAMQGAING